jgi:hypothetical protein
VLEADTRSDATEVATGFSGGAGTSSTSTSEPADQVDTATTTQAPTATSPLLTTTTIYDPTPFPTITKIVVNDPVDLSTAVCSTFDDETPCTVDVTVDVTLDILSCFTDVQLRIWWSQGERAERLFVILNEWIPQSVVDVDGHQSISFNVKADLAYVKAGEFRVSYVILNGPGGFGPGYDSFEFEFTRYWDSPMYHTANCEIFWGDDGPDPYAPPFTVIGDLPPEATPATTITAPDPNETTTTATVEG